MAHQNWNGFRGRAKRIDDVDLPRVGAMIGVGEDEIHAIIDVESSGSGFDAKGRPKMLFEPHIFYRETSGATRDRAVNAGLAYRSWGQKPYPRDSYPRLEAAMALNETAALRSASWGFGQVMGFNHVDAGYETVQDMVRAFMDDEDDHLEAMVRFIKANRLDDEVRAHNWAGFARGYNGAGYKRNKYDTRLAARYRFWRGKPDTKWNPADAEAEESDAAHEPGPPPAVAPPLDIRPDAAKPAKPETLWTLVARLIVALFGKGKG